MKEAVNPLLWLLALQFGCYWVLRSRSGKPAVVARAVLLFSMVVLCVIATQQFSQAVERLWTPPQANVNDFRPAYLVVLAGGWQPGEMPEEDFLGTETQRRVLHAAAVWRRHPKARLVLSGFAGRFAKARHPARQVELMAEMAHQLGVPPSSIVLEHRAANSSEHPVEVLKLPGIDSSTPVGIVTSGWHMRRAYSEFCRRFAHVAPYPVAPMRRLEGWASFLPTAGSLRDSSILLQEMVGWAWYRLRSMIEDWGAAARCRPLVGASIGYGQWVWGSPPVGRGLS